MTVENGNLLNLTVKTSCKGHHAEYEYDFGTGRSTFVEPVQSIRANGNRILYILNLT